MHLDIALRDLKEGGRLGPLTPPVKIEDQTFENAHIVVDNHRFRRCRFLKSTLWYAGGPCQFDDCEIDSETNVLLVGAAARGLELLERLRKTSDDESTPESS